MGSPLGRRYSEASAASRRRDQDNITVRGNGRNIQDKGMVHVLPDDFFI